MLINCSECGKEVSDKAPACPACGNPIVASASTTAGQKPKKSAGLGTKIVRTSLAVLVGIVVIAVIAGNNASKTAGPVAQAPEPPATSNEQPEQISARDLFASYKENEVAADAKYKGKLLAVSGVVGGISKDVMDDPYVTLVAENEFETVHASFSKDAANKLSKLRKGQGITVTCRGNGMVIMSPMLDCR